MKLNAKDAGDDVEMDMSPMIDMVFLLLIFFIVASQIIDEKPKVAVPAAAAATVPPEDDRLMISITKDDVFYFRLQQLPFEELTLKIQQEFEANNNLRILIRADGDVAYETNEKIMMACAEIGAVDIIFAATEE
ncbi:MAG: biopolymer transporter ExbD [Pontiellaceae bacterium]|nr:biopolymer transporter ExbD [Pontiellaceae bacterium]MBN2784257.1 biopolymer transporter ExbD [Pontiellaceae bacterium]